MIENEDSILDIMSVLLSFDAKLVADVGIFFNFELISSSPCFEAERCVCLVWIKDTGLDVLKPPGGGEENARRSSLELQENSVPFWSGKPVATVAKEKSEFWV